MNIKRFFAKKWLILYAALIYLIIPFDFIPEPIAFAGQLDDIIVVIAALLKFFETTKKERNIASNSTDTSNSHVKDKPQHEEIIDGEFVD